MSDNTAYGTAHHTHVTCADESQYEADDSDYIKVLLLETVPITS